MTRKLSRKQFGAAVALLLLAALASLLAASTAAAATNITNSLTGFTGNSSQPATQSAVAPAGLGFTRVVTDVDHDPTVAFDSSGATFGTFFSGDAGRNFIRTTATDFANYGFVADVTWVTTDMFSQAGYFGLGPAEYGNFRIADWGNQASAVQLFLEVDPVDPSPSTLKNDNGITTFQAMDTPGLDTGTNRLRLTYDWFAKTAVFAIDRNYTTGPFTADITFPAVSTLDLYRPDGWPTEAARVYFGGDDGTAYKDLQITLSTGNMVLGDLDNSGTITSADWVILRNNQNANLSALSFAQAYAMGDITADKMNDHADFKLFKSLYDAANGTGAFVAMLAGVPEPASGAMLLAAALFLPAARRARRRS